MADEMLPEEAAAPSGEVVLTDPHGQLVTVSAAEAKEAIEQGGYTPADPHAVAAADFKAAHSTLGQKALGFGEQALSAATLHASPILETKLGLTTPEDIQGRQEAIGPVGNFVAQGAGLLGGAALLPEFSAAKALGMAGDAGLEALGIGAGEGIGAKIGSAAAKGFIENSTYQLTDEASKLVLGEYADQSPGDAAETALLNTGLAGIIGAGISGTIGSVSPLWKASSESKVGKVLGAIRDKIGGIQGDTSDGINELIDNSGMNLAPEMKSAVSSDPLLRRWATELQDSSGMGARNFQKTLENTRSEASDSILETLGKSKDDLPKLSKQSDAVVGEKLKPALSDEISSIIRPAIEEHQLKTVLNENADKQMLGALGRTAEDVETFKNSSDFEMGQDVGKKIADEYKKSYEPIKEVYDELQTRFKKAPITDSFGLMGKLQDLLQKYDEDPSQPQFQILKKLIDVIPNVKSIEGLRNLRSSYAENAASQSLWQLSKQIKTVLFDQINTEIGKQLASEAPELIGKFQGVQNAYANLMRKTEFLNDRLHVGRYTGPETFANNLKDMIAEHPEQILRRLNPKNDAALIQFLKTEMPQSASAFQKHLLDKTISRASARASGVQAIHPDALFSEIEKLSPEMKAFVLPEGAMEHLSVMKGNLAAPFSAEYLNASDFLDFLNKRLRLGKFESPSEFLEKMNDLSPEELVRRLSKDSDSELLKVLTENNFTGTANLIREHLVNSIIKDSTVHFQGQETPTLNLKSFFKDFKKMSPEMRSFLVPPEAQSRISGIETLLNRVPSKENFSGTAPVLDRLWASMPSGVGAFMAYLTGHNPLVGATLGALGRFATREAPEAVKLGLMKFLGSSAPIESEGFKTMVDFIDHTMKGENLLSKSTKAVFKAGQEVLPSSLIASDKDLEKLDKKLKTLQNDPMPLMNTGGKLTHYMGNHGQALAQAAATHVNLLNQARPVSQKNGPLDKEIEPSKAAKATYQRALRIADQPVLALKFLKEGTLLPEDVQNIKMLKPSLYQRMSQKLTSEMLAHVEKGEEIPYKTRMGLSIFLGQPMDSTMTPMGIQSAQPMPTQPQGNNQQAPERAKHSMTALGKMSQMDETPLQARERNKRQ